MTTFQPSEILDEIKNLVIRSCNDVTDPNSIYNSLHKGIIKMYFEARNVEINYETRIIKVEIPVTEREYTTVSFECQDLSRFLNSCLKQDKRNLIFYQNALNYYSLQEVA